jgi:hypothetical protein
MLCFRWSLSFVSLTFKDDNMGSFEFIPGAPGLIENLLFCFLMVLSMDVDAPPAAAKREKEVFRGIQVPQTCPPQTPAESSAFCTPALGRSPGLQFLFWADKLITGEGKGKLIDLYKRIAGEWL